MSTQEKDTSKVLSPTDFKYIEMGYAFGENGFTRNHFGTNEIIQKIRDKSKNTGVYRSSFWYNSTDPYEADLFADFYMDFDVEEKEDGTYDIEKAREDLLFVIWRMHLNPGFSLPMDAFRIYFSGKKGFHMIVPWQYFGYKPSSNLDEIFKWIAQDLNDQSENGTIDLVVYERRRLFRLENSIHQDTGLYKIPLQYHEAASSPLDEIQDRAKNPRLIKYSTPYVIVDAKKEFERYEEEYAEWLKVRHKVSPKEVIPKGTTPDSVQELIDRGPVKGLRNETIAALTSFWNNQGYDKDEIWNLLLEWNQGSESERVLQTTMNSILKRGYSYSLSRFKALAEGDIGTDNSREEYKKYKKGRFR